MDSDPSGWILSDPEISSMSRLCTRIPFLNHIGCTMHFMRFIRFRYILCHGYDIWFSILNANIGRMSLPVFFIFLSQSSVFILQFVNDLPEILIGTLELFNHLLISRGVCMKFNHSINIMYSLYMDLSVHTTVFTEY